MINPSPTRRRLAQHIRILRVLRGWSQEQLADYCGLHRTYIGAVERGERNITVDNIDKIATAFGVPVSGLFGEGDVLQWADTLNQHRVREQRAIYRHWLGAWLPRPARKIPFHLLPQVGSQAPSPSYH